MRPHSALPQMVSVSSTNLSLQAAPNPEDTIASSPAPDHQSDVAQGTASMADTANNVKVRLAFSMQPQCMALNIIGVDVCAATFWNEPWIVQLQDAKNEM